MKVASKRLIQSLSALIALIFCLPFQLNGQIKDVPIEVKNLGGERSVYSDKSGKEVIRSSQGATKIDLKGCIQIYSKRRFVIRNEAAYLEAIRGDASRKWCVENLEKIDFSKYNLLGIEINSGYCRTPLGLQYQTAIDSRNKQFLLNISYIDPKGRICRALSRYEFWLLAPKFPDDYEVKFNVTARRRSSSSSDNDSRSKSPVDF